MKPTRQLVALALGAFAAASFAAAPVKQEQLFPTIVQFVPSLPSIAPDLSDSRISQRAGFGNLRPEVLAHVQRIERAMGFQAKHGFSHAVKGFSADLTATQVAQLKANPLVRLVEPDAVASVVAQSTPYGINASGAVASPAALAGDGLTNGVNLSAVAAFVVDTGVALHPDLNVGEQVNYVGDGIAGDCHGHGTHVAGTLGAKDDASFVVGMAPGVRILPLKVLGCDGSGSASNLIKAFDYAAATAVATPATKYVLNASIGFPPGTAISTLDTAVTNTANSGVLVSVAAGNNGVVGCTTTMVKLSSAQYGTGVMAVGAVDSLSKEASFSNYGSCLALWAPGVSVLSTSNTLATATMSGTSMAAPHVAGAAAVVRAANPGLTPVQVDERLKSLVRTPGTLSKDGRAIVQLDISRVTTDGTTPVLVGSVAQVTPTSVDFGVVKLRSSTVIRSVTVLNAGDTAMSLSGFANLPSGVTLKSSNCSNVAPGLTCAASFSMSTAKKLSFKATVSTVGAKQNGVFTMAGQVQ